MFSVTCAVVIDSGDTVKLLDEPFGFGMTVLDEAVALGILLIGSLSISNELVIH